MGIRTRDLSHLLGGQVLGMLDSIRRIVVRVYVACLACGLALAVVCFGNALSHWLEHVGEITPDGLPVDFRNILEAVSVGVLALVDTLLFCLVLVRRGSNLLAPVAYLGSSFVLTFWAMITSMTFAKSGSTLAEASANGGWWSPVVWISLPNVLIGLAVVLAITAGCLMWNFGMSSWRGLEGGALHIWTLRFRTKVTTA